nr:mandelate racemase [Armatimonadota bacterium]NIM24199.1 mandelate racemase [Armatimonadota bacterium]NIM68064.1 mandelate racemase [Armatimonadota bacterium]NIN06274.1 mandelate racemase [Armatimonadota bacterium]NIO97798.1 mandelate racemase [Armatimonadota bacterium]
GGISGLLKIAEICAARNTPLFPHGHSLHPALHVAAALPAEVLPQVEFLIHHQHTKQRFLKDYLEPQSGQIRLPDTPGLGIELDPAKAERHRELE